jgi:hypothetical protein
MYAHALSTWKPHVQENTAGRPKFTHSDLLSLFFESDRNFDVAANRIQ